MYAHIHKMMGWLANSRAVLEVNDVNRLFQLLNEKHAELKKIKTGFGKTKMGNPKITNFMAERKIKKDIARINTRLSQLRQKGINK